MAGLRERYISVIIVVVFIWTVFRATFFAAIFWSYVQLEFDVFEAFELNFYGLSNRGHIFVSGYYVPDQTRVLVSFIRSRHFCLKIMGLCKFGQF